MYVGIFFGLGTLVRLVRPCSMHVGILFGLNTLSTAMFSCMLVFYSILVRLVQPIVPFSSACMHGFLQLYHRAQHVTKTADITLSD